MSTDPSPQPGWRLSDLHTSHELTISGDAAATVTAVTGRLVQIVNTDGDVLSNRAVIDDPQGLANALKPGGASSGASRPPELNASDLDTALGSWLTWLHRNLVMDVSESSAPGASGGVRAGEEDEQSDESLWERLEHEQLANDPRSRTYDSMWKRGTAGADDPLIELLQAFAGRAPSPGDGARQTSTLAGVIRLHTRSTASEPGPAAEAKDDQSVQGHRRWASGTRIRVRARNALRRWAAAQSDRRLMWVNPRAPAGNFAMIAGFLVHLRIDAVDNPDAVELTVEDLDDLWERWLRPFVGTGSGDGWLDRLEPEVLEDIQDPLSGLPEMVSALSWLAVRPGPGQRERVLTFQPLLSAARDHDLLGPTQETATYLRILTGEALTPAKVQAQLEHAIDFIDDDLWCERVRSELGLDQLRFGTPSGAGVSSHVDVDGVVDPLTDPRLPRLVVMVTRYRHAEGIALYSFDRTWRLVLPARGRAFFVEDIDSDSMESAELITQVQFERIAADDGVIRNLFVPQAVA